MLRPCHSLFAAFLLLSCGDVAIDPSESLVGAEELPSAEALARETLYIARGGGTDGGDALLYELRPDHSLTVTHTSAGGRGAVEVAKAKETLRISPEAAGEIRELLRRVRPARLQSIDQDARPTGCERRGPDDVGEIRIGFVNEGDPSAISDDEFRIFHLPSAENCTTLAAAQARIVVRRTLQLLPRSEVAAEFDRAT